MARGSRGQRLDDDEGLGDGEDAASLLQRVSDHALLRGLRCHLVRAGEHSLAHEVQMQQAAVHLRGAGLTVDVTLAPGDATARWNLAVALLTAGRWREAWPLVEARR